MLARFLRIDKSTDPHAQGHHPFALWRLGFRPFYLLASAFASLSVALWAAQYAGWLPRPYLAGPALHAHEMLFRFTLAVVAGFLFTAVRNWTGLPTPKGKALAALAALWLAGRVLVLTPWLWAAATTNVVRCLRAVRSALLANPHGPAFGRKAGIGNERATETDRPRMSYVPF